MLFHPRDVDWMRSVPLDHLQLQEMRALRYALSHMFAGSSAYGKVLLIGLDFA